MFTLEEIKEGAYLQGKWSSIKRGHKEKASPLPVFSKSIFKELIKL